MSGSFKYLANQRFEFDEISDFLPKICRHRIKEGYLLVDPRRPPGKNQLTVRFHGSGARLGNFDMQAMKLMNFGLAMLSQTLLLLNADTCAATEQRLAAEAAK